MPKKNSVPYGWRSLQAVGTRVEGSRFIPFKVPLKGIINQRLTPNQKFTPKDLIAEIKAQGEELGLVIDLTNTNRYYEVKDLPKNVKYQKLPTAGLEIPDDDTILQFKKIVRKFLRQNPYNDKLVGVHCTTGLSRTGYLICRYLVDVEDWHPDAAIKGFTDTRNLTLDGRVYLSDLKIGRRRTNEGIDDVDDDELPAPVSAPVSEPARADWSVRSFPGTQSWSDFTAQRGVEDGNFMSRNQFQESMNMEAYDDRPVHGGFASENTQMRAFQRPGQRPAFPEERYMKNGRNPDFYQEPFAGQRSQNPMDEQYFNSRPELRARPFTGEPQDFREAANPERFDMPPGQRPRAYYGQSAQDDYQAPMLLEDAKPGQRMRPPMQGEPRDFPSERVWDLQKQDTVPRQGPRGVSGPQARAYDSAIQMEDDYSKRAYQPRSLPSHSFPNDGKVDGRPLPDRDCGPRSYGPQFRNFETDYQMGKFDGSNTTAPRVGVPPDSRPPFRKAPEMQDADLNGPARRPNASLDFSSYIAKSDPVGEQLFSTRPISRPFSIYDSHKETLERGSGKPGPKGNYPPEQLSERGPGFSAANKRMRLSDEGGPSDVYAPPLGMGKMDNRRYYPTPAEGTSDYSYGAPEGSLRGRTGLPRRSRFH